MGYKKHNWLKYNFGSRGNLIEVSLKDELNRKSDFFRCDSNKEFKKILIILKNKYGFGFDEEDMKKIIREGWIDNNQD